MDENMNISNEVISTNRAVVKSDYESAYYNNKELFLQGDVRATSEYTYDNQKFDAAFITDLFYKKNVRAISIIKRTKVGMNGLMVQLATNMATHPDDNFVLHRNKIYFTTAMNNKEWEIELKRQLPKCFVENIFHHGQLHKINLNNIKNALIIIDEIDTGDKEGQKLHDILRKSGLLDMNYMEENNIRFVLVSATMKNELQELYKWGDKHEFYKMTIPESYIGTKEFLELGIIQEYYAINDEASAKRWIKEDILDNYGTDYRVSIIRMAQKNQKFIINECIKNNIQYKIHNSDERISEEELRSIFSNYNNHFVIIVKNFYRRADMIPNGWKLRIGAIMEQYVKKYDTSTAQQAGPGRMGGPGEWRSHILNGHKTGPYRTAVKAMIEYEAFHENPFGDTDYQTNGSKKVFLNPRNIENIEIQEVLEQEQEEDKINYRIYDNEQTVKEVCKILGYEYRKTKDNANGFKETSLNDKKAVKSLESAISKVSSAYANHGEIITWRTYFPCYVNCQDASTLRFVVIIRPETDINKVITEIDTKFPSL